MHLNEILAINNLKPVELVTLVRISENENKKISQTELAKKVGVSRATMQRTILNLLDRELIFSNGQNGSKYSYSFKLTESTPPIEKPQAITPIKAPQRRCNGHSYSTEAFRKEMAEKEPELRLGGFRINPSKSKTRTKKKNKARKGKR